MCEKQCVSRYGRVPKRLKSRRTALDVSISCATAHVNRALLRTYFSRDPPDEAIFADDSVPDEVFVAMYAAWRLDAALGGLLRWATRDATRRWRADDQFCVSHLLCDCATCIDPGNHVDLDDCAAHFVRRATRYGSDTEAMPHAAATDDAIALTRTTLVGVAASYAYTRHLYALPPHVVEQKFSPHAAESLKTSMLAMSEYYAQLHAWLVFMRQHHGASGGTRYARDAVSPCVVCEACATDVQRAGVRLQRRVRTLCAASRFANPCTDDHPMYVCREHFEDRARNSHFDGTTLWTLCESQCVALTPRSVEEPQDTVRGVRRALARSVFCAAQPIVHEYSMPLRALFCTSREETDAPPAPDDVSCFVRGVQSRPYFYSRVLARTVSLLSRLYAAEADAAALATVHSAAVRLPVHIMNAVNAACNGSCRPPRVRGVHTP